MNLILVERGEIDDRGCVSLNDRRAEHILNIIKPDIGTELALGIVGEGAGKATVITSQHPDCIALQIDESLLKREVGTLLAVPDKLNLTLLIALPRPKVARRLVRLCAECGIDALHFINSYKVEKSFWQSPLLAKDAIDRQIMLGLEQSKDTQPPAVQFHKRFKPFVEDQLPSIASGKQCFVAHPYHAEKHIDQLAIANSEHSERNQALLVAVGPEGGFTPYEIDSLQQAGLSSVDFGRRIYRVETFIPLMLGKLR